VKRAAAGLLLLACLSCAEIGISQRSGRSWYRDSRRVVLDGDEVSPTTLNILRRRGWEERHRQDPRGAIDALIAEMGQTRARNLSVAIAELAVLDNRRTAKPDREALGTTVRYAYAYLFDPGLQPEAVAYDAQFRLACDLYATALADLLRQMDPEVLREERMPRLRWHGGATDLVVARNELHWRIRDFESLRIAYDIRVSGLPTPDSRRGLGVPCVLRHNVDADDKLDVRSSFLPATIEVAATVVFRFPDGTSVLDAESPDCLAEVIDPGTRTTIRIENRDVPLEFDVTTPIAAFLEGKRQSHGIRGLLNAKSQEKHGGLYTFQPVRRDKLLVLFIHGLASDPLTWLPLYNDLMANSTIRTRCQFAFWFYPTGQPLLYSACELRQALEELRAEFQAEDRHPADDWMVVCGHSMGGLLARTLVTDSGDRIWDASFSAPPADLDLTPDERALVRDCLVFEPLPYVRRVLFFATPHRGSPRARGNLADWASSLASMPADVERSLGRASRLPEWRLGRIKRSSIAGLRPDNPVLVAFDGLPIDPRTTYHSIVGSEDSFAPYDSAHLDGAASELVLPTGHSVQRDPRAAREARRILLEHLAAYDARK